MWKFFTIYDILKSAPHLPYNTSKLTPVYNLSTIKKERGKFTRNYIPRVIITDQDLPLVRYIFIRVIFSIYYSTYPEMRCSKLKNTKESFFDIVGPSNVSGITPQTRSIFNLSLAVTNSVSFLGKGLGLQH